MAGNKISKTFVWILMAMLFLGLGGFGITNLSGNIRSVGSVGDVEIGVRSYAQALQNEIQAIEAQRNEPANFAQIQAAGIDRAVLSQLVSTAAFDEEARRMGISVGDTALREQILDISRFQGIDGEFDREAYAFALEQTGISEADFEEDIRDEATRTLLQGAIVSGISVQPAYTDTLLNYVGEQRDMTWASLDRSDLITGLPVPSEGDLRRYHQTHLPDFTSPEVKQITYVWLTPEMIIDTVDVDEEALRVAYEERRDDFNQPERRLVERLAFADTSEATAALARINSGDTSFEGLLAERGLDLADIDLGDVAKGDLDAAADGVFAADVGDIVGPLDSAVGPALFRINGILQAQVKTLEDVTPQLRDELAGDRARRVIDAKIDGIDDLLAGGATVEDLAKETELELGQIDWHPAMTDDIGAYTAFRAAAQALTESDYPEVLQLEDDGIFAVRLDKVVEPAIQPIDEVREGVEIGWRLMATQTALREQLDSQLSQLRSGTSFEELGMEPRTATDLTRQGFQPDAPPEVIEAVFGMAKGDIELLEQNGQVFVLRVDDIRPPDDQNKELETIREALNDQAATGIANDLYQALASDIRSRVDIVLNEQALNAVHANFQ